MENRIRVLVKLLLTAILAILLIWLIYRDETFWQLKQPEGEMAKLTDVKILTEELEMAGTAGIDAQALEEFWAQQSAEEAEYLDYGTYKTLISHLGVTQEEFLYERKYRDEFTMLEKDWYEAYDKLLKRLGLEEIIQLEEVELLCGNENLVGEKKLENGQILDRTGRVLFPVSKELKEVHFETVKTYLHGDRLLVLVQELPAKQKLSNAWIMESDDAGLQVFYEGYEIMFPMKEEQQVDKQQYREQVADITYGEGSLQKIQIKEEKISGKLLSMGENTIEIEGHGSYELAENCNGYQLYDSLRKAQLDELPIGYDFSDFVLEDGKICAFLITRKEEMKNIRVAIKNSETGGLYHKEITLVCEEEMTIHFGKYDDRMEEKIPAGETLTIKEGSDYLKGDRVEIETGVNTAKIEIRSQSRTQGVPQYRGTLELLKEEEGIVLINELSLEEYLYSVVPSEMPASYPLEALKAQAICARTYGYRYMEQPGYKNYGAHVDDSVSYQVYNNIAENVNSTKAVKETAGTILYYGEDLVNVYYYSTSCGFGADAGVWNEEKKAEMPYLKSRYIGTLAKPQIEGEDFSVATLSEEEIFNNYITGTDEAAYEKEEAWFRWKYQVLELDVSQISERLKERYQAGADKVQKYVGEKEKPEESDLRKAENFAKEEPEKIKKIYDIRCLKRKEGGVMEELLLDTDKGIYKVISEYNIRYILNQGKEVIRQDGSSYESNLLLPSAYMVVNTVKSDENVIGYTIIGGGYGHGVGMSQNGAKAMGLEGMSCEEILTFYFEECHLENVYA